LKRVFSCLIVLGLAACGEETPKPPPAKPEAKAPETKAKAPDAKPPATAEAPKPDPDKELAARVKRVLEEDAKIHAAAIDVTASNGVVRLWGTAASDEERNRAAEAAMKVDGVSSVDNQIKVVRGS
jgi:hypothetical protein